MTCPCEKCRKREGCGRQKTCRPYLDFQRGLRNEIRRKTRDKKNIDGAYRGK